MTRTTGVSIVYCEDYDKEKVISAIDQIFQHFGGIQSIIKKGTRVLLKPNFIKESTPEECAVTHPIIIEVIAKKILEMEATPIIGDSPAFGSVSKIARRIGLDHFAKEHGIEIIELNMPRRIKTKCGGKSFSLTVSGKALDADAIINLPKLKAHVQLLYTAAVKNMYGCVSGKRKAWRHLQSHDDLSWYTEMLLANYQAVKPTFTIVDAVMAMEKHGPTGGTPRQVSLILGGIDCIAIDRVLAEVLCVSPSQAPLLKAAKLHNIGEQNMTNIEIFGKSLSTVKISDFILPKLVPIGFNTFKVMKSLAKHLWMKGFSKTILFLLTSNFLLPMYAFSEADRLKNFPSQVAHHDIVHIPTGEKVQFSDLARFFDCASVLYVGETHANKAAHQVQLKVLQAYYEKFGSNIAIGMEMFTRPYQPFLDQWIAGEIDEEKFLEDTRWDKEWGYDYSLYKDIFGFAREKKIPIIALNAPKELVKMLHNKGLKNLSEEEKKKLPEIDTTDFFHRIYLKKAIMEHVSSSTDFERYNDIQSLWEEYMAQTIVDYLSSWEGKDKKFLTFVGNGHIVYDFGIPKRVFRRTPLPYYTIYPAEFTEGKPTGNQDLFSTEIPLEPADFVWAIPPVEKEKKMVYLGVQLQKTSDDKLVIQEIGQNSPAEKAGFMVGDSILSIDGRVAKNVMDLVRYLQTKQFGDTCNVEIERGGTKITYSVTLFEIE
ncbi:MAG: ChaN family lipoprotein [Candidatus Jettenia caeni]|nr:ChaN family lipoprotein [Candidatus Jettenia caeni]